MNKLEKEYIDRFKNLGSLKGIDPDQLWDSISVDMENPSSESASIKKNLQVSRWSIFLLLFLLLGGLLCYNFKTPKSQKANNTFLPLDTQKASNDPILHTDRKVDPINSKEHSTIIDDNTNHIETTRLKKENVSNTPANLSSKSIAKSRSKISNEKKGFNDKTKQPNVIDNNQKTNFNTDKAKNLVKTKNTLNQKNINPSNVFNQSSLSKKDQFIIKDKQAIKPALPLVSSLPTLSFFIENNYDKKLELSLAKNKKTLKPKTSIYYEVAAYTGVNTMFLNYDDGPLFSELSEATESQLGWSNAFRISWVFNDMFSINSGINHDLIRIKFSTLKETTTTITDDNYLVRFGIDPQSGDTINQEYITKDRDALLKRNVVHHNHFNLLSIPLEIGFQKQKGKLGYGIKLGASPSFFINQKGKTFDVAKDIYIIDNTVEDKLPFKKFFIAYQINPFVDYNLSKKLKVRLNPIFKYQAFGKSSLYKLDQTGLLLGLNGGFVLRMSK